MKTKKIFTMISFCLFISCLIGNSQAAIGDKLNTAEPSLTTCDSSTITSEKSIMMSPLESNFITSDNSTLITNGSLYIKPGFRTVVQVPLRFPAGTKIDGIFAYIGREEKGNKITLFVKKSDFIDINNTDVVNVTSSSDSYVHALYFQSDFYDAPGLMCVNLDKGDSFTIDEGYHYYLEITFDNSNNKTDYSSFHGIKVFYTE